MTPPRGRTRGWSSGKPLWDLYGCPLAGGRTLEPRYDFPRSGGVEKETSATLDALHEHGRVYWCVIGEKGNVGALVPFH